MLGEGAEVGGPGIFTSGDGIQWEPTMPASPFPRDRIASGLAVAGRTISADIDGPSAWLGSVP